MTPAARLAAAIEALQEVWAASGADAPPADRVLDRYFRSRRYIGSKDRVAIAERVFGVLRRRARLDWWLAREGIRSAASARARALADLMLADGLTLEAAASLFPGGQYAPQPLAAEERALAARLAGRPLEPPDMPAEVRAECPAYLAERLHAVFGPRFAQEMTALNLTAPFDLRVNPLKAAGRDQALAALAQGGIEGQPTRLSPLGIRLDRRRPVDRMEAFRQGLIEVQDEGSQLVALVLGAKPGQKVLDWCAGAGGKTLAIAGAMANKGRLIACDVLPLRLKRAAERLKRAGAFNVETHVLGTAGDKWAKRHRGFFDRVLVDAPCSGSGTWRRNPDSRWRYGEADIERLVGLQAGILADAARLVAPGGRLVYATCALLPEENERQAENFLAAHPDFTLVPIGDAWRETIGTGCPVAGPYLALTPAQHGTDGFFAAVFERAKPSKEPQRAQRIHGGR
ncbi:MAG: RsmB/NOP family class I SAM-dependent RNA methyltransferase [Proteobacteria bacterium]|nr:RsmB/NOP family class I SAM-dependent RNA methyltransferase [Pseudomonadota bacterium]MBI3498325.1 RsmB/NOP family class I SAM-dependent RNA methyltransferase [Pseudomonadota bacterium]